MHHKVLTTIKIIYSTIAQLRVEVTAFQNKANEWRAIVCLLTIITEVHCIKFGISIRECSMYHIGITSPPSRKIFQVTMTSLGLHNKYVIVDKVDRTTVEEVWIYFY